MPDLFLELRDEGDARGTRDAPAITPAPLTEEGALDLLRTADFAASKLIPWGSNYSFAVALETPTGREQLAIYKPRSGETPLYDFADGTLYRREVASYLLSHALGWNVVPPTVARDGPHGIGSVQLYVEPLPDGADTRRFWGSCQPQIEQLVLFDHLANNADRKIGHCLLDRDRKVWGIDHGLTFNRYPKLRTVLWQYVNQRIAPDLRSDLRRLRVRTAEFTAALAPYLDRHEIDALWSRLDRLVETGVYPHLNPRRNVPYGWW